MRTADEIRRANAAWQRQYRASRRPTKKAARCFWLHVLPVDECWEWQLGRDKDGYGRVKYQGRTGPAQRVAWELVFGPIPDGMLVCHHCDNRACCRPDHLFLGTPTDNMADRDAKDRQARGETITKAKLHPDKVRRIRSLASGVTQEGLALGFGVSQSTISSILTGHTWRHVS